MPFINLINVCEIRSADNAADTHPNFSAVHRKAEIRPKGEPFFSNLVRQNKKSTIMVLFLFW